MFKRGMFTILLDFFLEKKSPVLGLSEKKHNIGNNFATPMFDPLLQIVQLMVRRTIIPNQNNSQPNTLFKD